ncbi:hypothetical protein HAX54_017388, partial [Datura stramonium]|nr:hypothetical protein [Datura stramonium]
MAPKTSKGKVWLLQAMEIKGKEWVKKHIMRMVASQQPLQCYGLCWVTNQEGKCNLNIMREYFANWKPKERTNQVKIKGQIVNFTSVALNRLLGTPIIEPQPMKDLILRPPIGKLDILILRPPYREIIHTLNGPNSIA